jgi:hypothetical protein
MPLARAAATALLASSFWNVTFYPEAIYWLHVPKTGGSSFVVAIYRYACDVPIEAVAAAMDGDCRPPCQAVTTPYPPEERCALVDGMLDGHSPPAFPAHTGRVVSLFRRPAALKASWLAYAALVSTNASYLAECNGGEAPAGENHFFRSQACHAGCEATVEALAALAANLTAGAADAAGARCAFLEAAVPRLLGAQTRLAYGGHFLTASLTDTLLDSGLAAADLLRDHYAFVGMTERFAESICAFHLSLGGPAPDAAAFGVHARRTPESGVDWEAEAERCGQPIGTGVDPADEELYEQAGLALDRTVAAIGRARMEACLALDPSWEPPSGSSFWPPGE